MENGGTIIYTAVVDCVAVTYKGFKWWCMFMVIMMKDIDFASD